MLALFRRLSGNYHSIIANAGALIATTGVTSGLGFVYWWVAARLFPQAAVGFAAAAISTMTLLGTVGMFGLGTLLISLLPRTPGREPALLATGLSIAGLASLVLGLGFALLAPALSPELAPLGRSPGAALLFALGVGYTAMGLVLDQALVGMLRGGLQLARNVVFAVAKLVVLLVAGRWLAGEAGLGIYATWAIGSLLSFVVLAQLARSYRGSLLAWLPDYRLLSGLGRSALSHHALNLALLAPGMLLPLLVTTRLSAALNASFYIAWMLVNFVFVGPASLSTVLYAVGANDATALAQKTRFTLRMSLLVGLAAVGATWLLADVALGVFGRSYAVEAAFSLRLLSLGVFPLIIKDHFVAISRIRGRIGPAALLITALGIFELIVAALGARSAGLPGLCLGWVGAMAIGTIFMARLVYATAANAPQHSTALHEVEGAIS